MGSNHVFEVELVLRPLAPPTLAPNVFALFVTPAGTSDTADLLHAAGWRGSCQSYANTEEDEAAVSTPNSADLHIMRKSRKEV